jgi:hypothetical protein
MGRKAKIDRMPPEAREFLNELLRNPAISQCEMTAKINHQLVTLGLEPSIKEDNVNRYAARVNKVGSKLAQSREVAELWVNKMGSAPSGKLGLMLNEIIGTLAFDLTLDLSENPDTNVDRQKLAKTLKDLSQLVKTLEEASQVNEKRTAKLIRDAKLEAAEAIEKECVKKGLSSDAVKTFRAGLGFEDGHDIIDI